MWQTASSMAWCVPSIDATACMTEMFWPAQDDHDEFGHQVDWHAPGKAEDRLDQLCQIMVNQLPHQPSIIQLHSGLWDCSYFARIDRRSDDEARRNADMPLTKEQMEWWQTRMTSLIHKIKSMWPNTPIVYRKLHRPRAPQESFAWTSGQENLGYAPACSQLRVVTDATLVAS